MGLVRKPSWRGPGRRGGLGLLDPFGITDVVGVGNSFGQGVRTSDWANCRGWSSYLNPGCYFAGPPSNIAPVGAPTGNLLRVPPASGVDAQATVDALANQQLIDQQAIAGAQVTSSTLDQVASGLVAAGDTLAAPLGISWLIWLAGGIGVFAMVAMGGGRPRRYGR